MSDSPIERMAIAMMAAMQDTDCGDMKNKHYYAMARAALAAIGGPTEAMVEAPAGQWVKLEEFRGEPHGNALCWWWDEYGVESVAVDEILLDEHGRICGKGGCGADQFSHVMLAGFERPAGPRLTFREKRETAERALKDPQP